MTRVAVCDDAPIESAFLQSLLLKYGDKTGAALETTVFGSAEALLAALEAGGLFDVFMLDIVLPGMDGISLAKKLHRRAPQARVVFLTGSDEYQTEAFTARAAGYLIKPVSYERLAALFDELLAAPGQREQEAILVQTAAREERLPVGDIVAVRQAEEGLSFHLAGGGQVLAAPKRGELEQLVPLLANHACFVSPAKGCLVNLTHVKRLSRYELLMDEGSVIPVAKPRFGPVGQAYTMFLAGHAAR